MTTEHSQSLDDAAMERMIREKYDDHDVLCFNFIARKAGEAAAERAIDNHVKETEIGHYKLGAKVAAAVVTSGVIGGLFGSTLGKLLVKIGEAISKAA